MGEALITRRGGGFELEGILSLQSCSLEYSNTSSVYTSYVTVPDEIDIDDIKGFILTGSSGITIFYNKDGKFIWKSVPDYSFGYPNTLTIDGSRQIANPSVGRGGSIIILY